jgi:hypothetical protein
LCPVPGGCRGTVPECNLPAVTYRDANAHSLLDMLDLSRLVFAEPPRLAGMLLSTDPNADACSIIGPGTILPPYWVDPRAGKVAGTR